MSALESEMRSQAADAVNISSARWAALLSFRPTPVPDYDSNKTTNGSKPNTSTAMNAIINATSSVGLAPVLLYLQVWQKFRTT